VKAYLAVSGAIFGLLGIAHLFRLFTEGHPASDPFFLGENVALFVVSAALAVWALQLLRRPRGPST